MATGGSASARGNRPRAMPVRGRSTSRHFEYPYSIDTNLMGLVSELLTKRELLRSLQPILSSAVAPSLALGSEHEFAPARSTQTMRGGPSNLSYCALTEA
jgi:hypothetical protein